MHPGVRRVTDRLSELGAAGSMRHLDDSGAGHPHSVFPADVGVTG